MFGYLLLMVILAPYGILSLIPVGYQQETTEKIMASKITPENSIYSIYDKSFFYQNSDVRIEPYVVGKHPRLNSIYIDFTIQTPKFFCVFQTIMIDYPSRTTSYLGEMGVNDFNKFAQLKYRSHTFETDRLQI